MSMMKRTLIFALSVTMLFAAATYSFAQGKGKGKSKVSTAKPTVTKKDTDTGTKRNSQDREYERGNSNRRINDDGDFERKINSRLPDDKELNRFKGLAKKLNTIPEILRGDYREALYRNPDLKFGQFMAANVIANNHYEKNPNITVDAILYGLEDGQNLGQTLKNLGMSSKDSKRAQKRAESEIEKSRKEHVIY